MAVLDLPVIGFDREFIPDPEKCFLCFKEFSPEERIVYWSGSTSFIFLHTGCARDLGRHLIVDDALATGKHFKGKLTPDATEGGHRAF